MRDTLKILDCNPIEKGYESPGLIYLSGKVYRIKYRLIALLVSGVIILFLPWTQNIRAEGSVTTLRQEARPQELNSVIGGRIVKWYHKEGDYVEAGDTIVQLAEIKDSYLDPALLKRTQEQIVAKQSGIEAYKNKTQAIDAQLTAMASALQFKLRQLTQKVMADSMDFIAASIDYKIAEEQLRRMRIMRDSGLASMVQIEQRIQANQSMAAKKMSAETKFINTKTELLQVTQEYNEKMFKARSERASAMSDLAAGEAELAKLNNQYANYLIRNGMYFLLAPQGGQLIQAAKSGINEIVKDGEKIAEIVPQQTSHAVEMFVKPVDLPLVNLGQKVRFTFDGFPAVVFRGWPQASYGIFNGIVVAVESSVSPNGKFRVLVAQDSTIKAWPPNLKMGTGADAFALLKDVPVWYELWRNINGFPPDFYQATAKNDDKNKPKK